MHCGFPLSSLLKAPKLNSTAPIFPALHTSILCYHPASVITSPLSRRCSGDRLDARHPRARRKCGGGGGGGPAPLFSRNAAATQQLPIGAAATAPLELQLQPLRAAAADGCYSYSRSELQGKYLRVELERAQLGAQLVGESVVALAPRLHPAVRLGLG